MCAVLGLWVVHVILGFNQNWLEMPLMLCHTAAQYFMAGGLWEEHHLLPGVNTVCPMLSAISTSYCCPNLCHLSWSLWDLCVKWKLCLGARLVNCLNRRSKMFLSFSWSLEPLLMGKVGIATIHPHWRFEVLAVTARVPAQIQRDEP